MTAGRGAGESARRAETGNGGRRQVVITGAGVMSPLGDSPAALHRALAAGTSGRKPIELFDTSGIGCCEGGEIRPFDPQSYVGERNLRPLDRTSRLLVVAAQLALADSGWAPAGKEGAPEIGLVLGTTFCSVRTIAEFDRRALRLGPSHASPLDFANSVINAAAGQAAIWHGLRGVNSTVAGGEASGLLAIAQAVELVRARRAEAVLAGGAEELCFESFFGYARAGRLCGSRRRGEQERPVPCDARRNGFSLSEGAALLMLEEAGAAASRGAVVRAEVLGWGAAFAVDPGEASLATAVARAVRSALADAGTAPVEIGCWSASASGSREVDRAEALGVAAALGERVATLPVTAIKAMLGEGLGVSGAWQALDLVATIGDGVLPGIAGLEQLEPGLPLAWIAAAATRQLPEAERRRALVSAVGADGHCAALVLGAPGPIAAPLAASRDTPWLVGGAAVSGDGEREDPPGAVTAPPVGIGDAPRSSEPRPAGSSQLVPRFTDQGYGDEEVAARRRWVEERTGARLTHAGRHSVPGEQMRGNVENPIGAAQVPLGVAGPLAVHGEHARGIFYVPLATTEGAVVRSYERGMIALTRAGGVTARLYGDENKVAPLFRFDGVAEARAFCLRLPELLPEVRAAAEATTRHGRLLRLEPLPLGRAVMVSFCYSTADAHGMNMIAKATEAACELLVARGVAGRYTLFSAMDSEKRASGGLLAGGKGKQVVAGARLPARLVRAYLHTTPGELREVWEATLLGHLQAGAIGYNGQYANGLAALFIACGQDVANVANSAVGVTHAEVTPEGDLYASVTLPSLTVATVGGGTGSGTARECLEMLGCAGDGGAPKLAEITAATLLAGELSMGAALASGEFVAAHEAYGRNPPGGPSEPPEPAAAAAE